MKSNKKSGYASLKWTPSSEKKSFEELKAMYYGSAASKKEVLTLITSWGIDYKKFFRRLRDLEALSNQICLEVCLWIKENGGNLPRVDSTNLEERKMRVWIDYSRIINKKGALYTSTKQIAVEMGFPDLLEPVDREFHHNETTRTACKFYKKYGKYPSTNSSDPDEKKLGQWLSNGGREAKKKDKLYASSMKIAKEMGVPNLFETEDQERLHNLTTRKACKFYQKHRYYPSNNSSDPDEKKMARWLSNSRTNKKKRNLYASSMKIAKEMGVPDLFETEDLEARHNDMTRKACKFFKEHGNRFPRPKSPDPEEKVLGQWLNGGRTSKNNGNLYASSMKISKEMGVHDLFEQVDMESRHNHMTRNACRFFKNHGGQYPSQNATDPEEKRMGQWLGKNRTMKKKRNLYASSMKIAKEMGVPDLFETEDLEARHNDMTRKACKFFKEHGNRFPSQYASGAEELKLSRWLNRSRLLKKRGQMYTSSMQIAKEMGVTKLFNGVR